MPPFPLKRILVPTDLSPAAVVALRYARLFAEKFDASLSVFYVDPIIYPVEALGVEAPIYITNTPEHLAQIEHEVRAYADETLHDLPYSVFAVGGQPVPIIIHEAQQRHADLIVMATHGLRGWRRAILGSVTQGVLHGGDCAVLSVSRTDEQKIADVALKTIVCPVNFTDVSRESLIYAGNLAAMFDAQLIIVHVVEDEDALHASSDEARFRSWIDRSLQEKCTYREIFLRGGAAERVLDFAEDTNADLMVVGAQHKAFRDETVIGTTTERLVRFARLPVLTVPRPLPTAVRQPERRIGVAAAPAPATR